MPVARDPAVLLRLAADITRAGRDPAAWPEVFEQISTLLDCSAVFRADAFAPAQSDADRAAVAAALSGRAAECAREARERCAADPQEAARKREICRALGELLVLTVDAAGVAANGAAPVLGSLDTIPRPLFIVRRNAQLLHANAAGWQELRGENWLTHEDGHLCFVPRRSRGTLRQYLARAPDRPPRGKECLRLSRTGRGAAELWVRPLGADDDREHYFLLSLVNDATRPGTATPMHGLTPRQQELARHLLAGRNLAEAALQMGIERRTAKDHLSALFRHSQTRRQAELVAWLTRQELT